MEYNGCSPAAAQRRILAQQGLTEEALWEKFNHAAREEVRLAVALEGFAHSARNEAYRAYLSRRLRPAVQALLEENQVAELAALEQVVGFTREQVDDFLAQAIQLGRAEAIAWLLGRKTEEYGFRDRDFSL